MTEEAIIACLYTAIAIIAAIPAETAFPWVYNQSRSINAKLEKPTQMLHFSKAPILFGLTLIFTTCKAYIPLSIARLYLSNTDFHYFLILTLVLLLHAWSPYANFRNHSYLLPIIFGIYFFMNPIASAFFLGMYLLGVVFFNSLSIGLLTGVISLFFVVSWQALDPSFLVLNFVIFLVCFFAQRKQIFRHFEKEALTLLKTFESRP
ncbi:MAG: glycerol-3-phosphate acyltransferase PlsY [Candidatus Marinamargulisbacteria bacterium]